MVLYAMVANTSVGYLFLGGVLPFLLRIVALGFGQELGIDPDRPVHVGRVREVLGEDRSLAVHRGRLALAGLCRLLFRRIGRLQRLGVVGDYCSALFPQKMQVHRVENDQRLGARASDGLQANLADFHETDDHQVEIPAILFEKHVPRRPALAAHGKYPGQSRQSFRHALEMRHQARHDRNA